VYWVCLKNKSSAKAGIISWPEQRSTSQKIEPRLRLSVFWKMALAAVINSMILIHSHMASERKMNLFGFIIAGV